MKRYLAAYGVVLLVMLVIDLIWLAVIAKPMYQRGIGHLMADKPNLLVAALFYAVFALGLVIFAVAPHAGDWQQLLLYAGLFGFFTYATYDLTNLATLKDWPVGLAAIDMLWGTLVSMVVASAGKFVLDRMA